jgi:hypothetical protein
MIQTVGIFVLFAIMVFLMMKGNLSFLISLPVLALGVAIIAGVPFFGDEGIMKVIFEGGTAKMASSFVAVSISAWIGAMMNNTGISKTIIKTAAELGGDKPLLVTVFLAIATALIFTTIAGLGAVIMVGTIVVPIMISVGVPGLIAVTILLFACSTGIVLFLPNWVYYTSLTGVSLEQVQLFAWILCGLTAVVALVFILFQFKKEGIKFAWATEAKTPEVDLDFQKAPLISLLTPIVPIILVVAFKWTIITAMFTGLVYCSLTTVIFNKKMRITKMLGLITKSAIEGMSDAALGIMSLVVIGMLAASLSHPSVAKAISSTVALAIPSTRVGYILFFALLTPLALYRGPMNMWGVGAGFVTIVIATKILPAPAVMCGFVTCGMMQLIGDPTNSFNIWLANYVGTDTMTMLKKTFPFVWGLCVVAVVISGFMWF